MTNEFNGFGWVYGMWYCGNDAGNWMGTLGKRDGKWVFEYRFRYFSPESKNPFDGVDEKNWYAYSAEDTPENLARFLDTCKRLCVELKRQYGNDVDFVDLQCAAGDPKILFELGSREWANIKLATEEDLA